jgi:hypothetical protein
MFITRNTFLAELFFAGGRHQPPLLDDVAGADARLARRPPIRDAVHRCLARTAGRNSTGTAQCPDASIQVGCGFVLALTLTPFEPFRIKR